MNLIRWFLISLANPIHGKLLAANRLQNYRYLRYAKMKLMLNYLKQGLFLLYFVARPLCMEK